jgi:hypothetical protein
MSNNFIKAIDFTLPWETGRTKNGQLRPDGGYTNYASDPGGETKWGISKRAHPELDIKNLTLDRAFIIYKTDYYDIYKGLKTYPIDLDSVPVSLAVSIFDTGVNVGVGRTANWCRLTAKEKDPTASLLSLRLEHYNKLKENMPQYYNGWINRLNDLKKYIAILTDGNS